MSVIYIGAFPPQWGGVTVKNDDLFNELTKNGISIEKVDLNKIKRSRSIKEALRLIRAITGRNNRLIIGVSAGSRRIFTKLLYLINKRIMSRSVVVVMGGAAARELSSDSDYMKWMSEFKRIYVETYGMAKLLMESGMRNVSIYPNCRKKAAHSFISEEENSKLQCVFFSLIQKQKGVDTILKSAKDLPEIDFSFYGPIDSKYKDEFEQNMHELGNCTYKGLFKGTDEEKYRELAKYDILLLPTRWTTEGIPGILVEAKIAGLTCIVSDVSYNSEIVTNGINGIVLARNDDQCLKEAISFLNEHRNILLMQKNESFKSADDYYIESYLDLFIQDLKY